MAGDNAHSLTLHRAGRALCAVRGLRLAAPLPPPPPPAPVFVREVEPQMRYNVQGAPIKHFGPPIGGSGWKPAPQTEYSVPIRTSPETEGQLGFSDGFGSASEGPQAVSRGMQPTPLPQSGTYEPQLPQGKTYGAG
mmetsp:Transcript_12477/g.29198  ORF Transcript_12477/g.29198 Transcript_12477/m.29198 type:complete len:136 (-) Transcript_12477:314-721(-)